MHIRLEGGLSGTAGRSTFQTFLFTLALFLLFVVQTHPSLVNPDGIGYYAYVRSLFLDKDLNLLNEFEALGMIPPFIYRTSTDLIGNQYPIGSAVLWAPFFLLGHGYTLLSRYFYPIPVNPDGYSVFYFIFIALGTSFYGILGLFLVYEVGKRLFPPRIVLLAVFLIIFGTPFFYYLFIQPTLAHVNSFFTLSLFLYVWFFTRNNRTLWQWTLLGLAAGLMGLVRTQNLVFILLPLLEPMNRGWRMEDGESKIDFLSSIFNLRSLIFLASLLFALIPQMLTWQALYGTPFSSTHGTMNLSFQEWHLWELLFSPFHGLFFYAPLLLLTLPGFYILAEKDFLLGTTLFAIFLFQILLNSWALYWWSGYAFGSRFFVDYTFLFILALAAFIHRRSSLLNLLSSILLGGFTLWNFLLLIQTLLQKLDLNQYIPLSVLLQGQLWALKNIISSTIQILFSPKLPLRVLLYLLPVFLFVAFAIVISSRLLLDSASRLSVPATDSGQRASDTRYRAKLFGIFWGCYLLAFTVWLSFAYAHTKPYPHQSKISRTTEDFRIFLRTQSRVIYEDYLQKWKEN
jgi:hypothetical protein